jgi:hypothetical protein
MSMIKLRIRPFSIIVFFLMMLGKQAISCDVCGCSASGLSGGMFPQIQSNMLGWRFTPAKFTHPATLDNMNGASLVKEDRYTDQELFFRWYAHKRLQLWITAPYRIHERIETLRTTTIQGIGDMQASALYTIVNTNQDTIHRNWKHIWLAGAGVSLPTGKYRQRDETLTTLPNGFQLGTGAYSAVLNSVYLIRYKRLGVQVQGDYRTWTANESQFKKGDQYSVQSQVFYRFPVKSLVLLPQAGMRYEHLAQDIEFDAPRVQSGSTSSWASAGLDIYAKHWMLGCSVQSPVQQTLTSAQPSSGVRFSVMAGIVW